MLTWVDAGVATWQHAAVHPLGSFHDRAWFAWHCMPRSGRKKRPPSRRSLEAEHGLSGGTFSKVFSGDRQSVDAETAKKMAVALNVSIEWLLEGRGPAPVPTGPVPSRYEEHGLQSADLDRWVKAATTDAGELDASRLTETNNFEAAARSVQDSIGKRVVNNVRKRHRDQYPNGFSQIRWFIEFGREKERLAQMAKAKGAKGSGAKSDDETKAG